MSYLLKATQFFFSFLKVLLICKSLQTHKIYWNYYSRFTNDVNNSYICSFTDLLESQNVDTFETRLKSCMPNLLEAITGFFLVELKSLQTRKIYWNYHARFRFDANDNYILYCSRFALIRKCLDPLDKTAILHVKSSKRHRSFFS